MPAQAAPAYTFDEMIEPDGSVHFGCSIDARAFPWLELAPDHPIVIQTQNYWASVGASAALGTREEGKWSALTWTDWRCGEKGTGHAVRGTFSRAAKGDDMAFETRLFDADDREIVMMRGKGVVFRTRNFERWREGSKKQAGTREIPKDFAYAPRELLGLSEHEVAFISPLDRSGRTLCSTALITSENGLRPSNRYIGGSGDHVNTTHLAEIGRQVASLMAEGAPIRLSGGEMDMHRYVELGCPLAVEDIEEERDRLSMHITQLGKSCANLCLQIERL